MRKVFSIGDAMRKTLGILKPQQKQWDNLVTARQEQPRVAKGNCEFLLGHFCPTQESEVVIRIICLIRDIACRVVTARSYEGILYCRPLRGEAGLRRRCS